ncbi:MAG: radical SAM protein [Nitrospira sp.]|nr:radical SAM protein [Nitrospira sp.]
MLSSICDYQCAYCPERLHDGRVRFPSWEQARRACRNLVSARPAHAITILFTGGEPTLYPHLQSLAYYARELGARVAILSNGGRPRAWWNNAWGWLDHAVLSFHPGQANPDHFLDVVCDGVRRIPIQVNLMMMPSVFDDCIAFAHRLDSQASGVVIHYKPVQDNWCRLGDYSPAQQEVLLALNQATIDAERTCVTSVLKGNLKCFGPEGQMAIRTPTELLLRNENHWRDWTCSVGLDSVFVRWDQVFRGVCTVGGVIGSIYDENLELPDKPVQCDRPACTCIGGIKSLRWAPGEEYRRQLPVRS